jgi:hypothetical protein
VTGNAPLKVDPPDGVAIRTWALRLARPTATERDVVWDGSVNAQLVADGRVVGESSDGQVTVPASLEVRDYLKVVDEVVDLLPTPLDMVELEWADQDQVTWTVQRRPSGGSWSDIGHPNDSSYLDGPLEDGTYEYRVVAEDPEGDTATSDVESVTISSAPEPPSDLSVSVSSGTLELTWTASPSSDGDHYAVYRAQDGDVEPWKSPHATPAGSPWSEDVSTVTGRLLYLVRAVDSDGNEEANVSQMVAVELESGAEVARPNSPTIIEGRPAAGGEVEVVAGYTRADEGGEATKLNLYVNDGAGGAIDWGTVEASASLPGYGSAQVTLTSSGLTAGSTYKCGVRAETAAGVEDTNTAYIEVTADDDTPAGADLRAGVV